MVGLSIDNTSEVHSTINVTIAVRETLSTLEMLLTALVYEDKQINEAESNLDRKFELISQLIGKINDLKKSLF